jgi:hypothetical protein
LQAYRDEIVWLKIRVKDYEAREPLVSAEYVHRANNLQTVIEGFERLNARAAPANEI